MSLIRANNLIIHNIPEDDLSHGGEILADDDEKLQFLIDSACIDVSPDDVISLQRLGKKQSGKVRPLKITLKNPEKKFSFLNKRKMIIMNDKLKTFFHNRIYVNSDNSFLVQKEEYRLRQRLKEMKDDFPGIPAYIRSGALLFDGKVVDKVDIKNQLGFL